MNTQSMRSAGRCLASAATLAATIAAFVQPVAAADLPIKATPHVVTPPSWAGLYVGVHGGAGWGNTRIDDPSPTPTFRVSEMTSSGPLAGAQLGVNWQFGNVVAGLEVDGSWASLRSPDNRPVIALVSQTVYIRALATGTARIGYAMGPWLAYAKAGGAWADMRLTTQFLAQPTIYDRSRFGATAGAGMEVAFLRNVSARLEYNFVYLPADDLLWSDRFQPASIDHFVHLVKAGVNIRFGGDGIATR